jgi:sulfite exporter TauE/SafE
MLASITPLGERGRRSRWELTVFSFAVGAILASAGFGALIGAVGSLVVPRSVGEQARLAVLAAALVAAIVIDLRRSPAPGPRRQVNERWLDEFRGWVYGLGFGAQLGLAVTTVISSAATYVTLLAALLSGSWSRGAVVVGCFGLIRGLTPLLSAGVHTSQQLIALHRGLDGRRSPARRLAVAALAVMLASAVVGALA